MSPGVPPLLAVQPSPTVPPKLSRCWLEASVVAARLSTAAAGKSVPGSAGLRLVNVAPSMKVDEVSVGDAACAA
ncbi:MAG TPA: hypothetical protein VKP11_02475 [Frankiaceae bacterium]|nr:hypothetical protein [Frankiaceae bacterium]